MGDDATPSIILGRPFLATGRALIDVQKGELTLRVHDEQMAMQYPREEDKGGCLRIDVIEELIREVQQEEAMSKLQAKQARYNDLDDTNHNFVMQKIVEEVQKIPYEV
ncbi:hypothetical protein PIB30_092456 [Stylosanthes scabra]|uniref:Reverse transcriptase domain-containing protein n=1 Tax=Stylosanthes scabra TaxID=79078 RepID=A0ABU6VYK2_9FABA|nr:hypothetical protein [Stylosanthes scabra]